MTVTDREREIDELYEHLAGNWRPQSGLVPLGECDPPAEAGVYVFFEPGEVRRNGEPRIVRVGKAGSIRLDINLRSRLLRMHLHGTHRDEQYDDQNRLLSSVFRKHVGRALIRREGLFCPTWGKPSAPDELTLRRAEADVEGVVTGVLSEMLVAWIPIPEPSVRKECEEGNDRPAQQLWSGGC